jgi:hypothetical protein
MRLMHRILIAALLVPAVLLFACGGGSEKSRVESVLRDYIDRYIESKPAEMYALLDSGSQAQCSEEDFVAFISAAREALGEREFKITEIRDTVIDGESASATVVSTVDGEQSDPTENTLVKENGNWRLVLPSGSC